MNNKEALALARRLQTDAGLLVAHLDGIVNPPVPADPRVEVINRHLNGQGKVIIEAAKRTGLSLADACALVEQESKGRNIFEIGTPPEPWDGETVTAPLIKSMINRPGYRQGNASMWGVGLTQLTWYTFVLEAEKIGGAHLPLNQCLVGFKLLKKYLNTYPRERAIASYNAGEPQWWNGRAYAQQVMAKARAWEERLGTDEPDDDPEKPWIKIEPRDEWSKGAGPYVVQFPTNYDLDLDVKRLAEKYINLPRFYRKVSANTYEKHPPANPRPRRSVDFWGWDGRGVPLDDTLQRELTETIFDDPAPPLIDWIISNGRMWVRDGNGWRDAPGGAANSDAGHFSHVHVTYRIVGGN